MGIRNLLQQGRREGCGRCAYLEKHRTRSRVWTGDLFWGRKRGVHTVIHITDGMCNRHGIWLSYCRRSNLWAGEFYMTKEFTLGPRSLPDGRILGFLRDDKSNPIRVCNTCVAHWTYRQPDVDLRSLGVSDGS